jgi:hypothetical protein
LLLFTSLQIHVHFLLFYFHIVIFFISSNKPVLVTVSRNDLYFCGGVKPEERLPDRGEEEDDELGLELANICD